MAPASTTLGNNIFIVEYFEASIEEDLQLTPMIQILCVNLWKYLNKMLFNSDDSPETLKY